MNTVEAMQHGLGYAAGREDASNVKTAEPGSVPGFMAFASAYARGHDRYNKEIMHFMVPCRDAYDAWQESGGRSIYRLAEQSEYALTRLMSDGDTAAGEQLAERHRYTRNALPAWF